eukprot:TRINITY_DN21502_c0_g1_i2.p1 TRINITY_DN21502_c0_g1~~TRINITY_DN21502_c0_g1_i2.p1  ORF type:complete len:829 (-),score=144.86 TRINITY_DN21502_c0_g1_i2:194-2524(-)
MACKVMSTKGNQKVVDLQTLGCLAVRMSVLRDSEALRDEAGTLACRAITEAMQANQGAAALQHQGCAALLLLATDSPANQDRIRKSGGVALTLQGAAADERLIGLQVCAMELLHVLLVGNKQGQAECMTANAIKIVNASMGAHLKELTVQSPALDVLALLLPFPGEVKEKSQEEEQEIAAVKNVVSAMAAHPSDFDLQSMAALILERVTQARGQKVADAIMSAGGIDTLSSSIKMHGEYTCLVSPAMGALGQITMKAKRESVERKFNTILTDVVNSMQRHPSVVRVQRGACEALRGMVAVSGGPLKIHKAGGYDACLSAMITHRKDIDVQDSAFQVLGSLNQVGKIDDPDVVRKAIECVMKYLRTQGAQENLHLEGMQVLSNLSKSGQGTGCNFDSETYALILEGFNSAMQAVPADMNLQLFGCTQLAVMNFAGAGGGASSGAYRKRAAGAVDSVVQAMKSFPENSELQSNALKALQNLTKAGAEACVRISACGGLDRIHTVVQDYAANNTVQSAAFDTLTCLTAMAGTFKLESASADVSPVEGEDKAKSPNNGTPSKVSRVRDAFSVLESHKSLSTAFQMTKGALSKPSSIVIYTKMGVLGGMESIMSIMRAQKISKESMLEGLRALRVLTGVSDTDNGYRFLRLPGGIDVILKVMKASPKNLQVQEEGVGTLANLIHADGADEMMERDVASMIMEIMQVHKASAILQYYGCMSIQGIAAKKKHAVTLAEMNALDVVEKAVRAFPEDSELVDMGCAAVEGIIAFEPRQRHQTFWS